MTFPVSVRYRLPGGTTTFYTNYATGSDTTGDGSSGNPWKTANYALSYIGENFDFSFINQTQAVIRLASGMTDLQPIHSPPHAMVGAQGLDALIIQGGTNSVIDGGSSPAIGGYINSVLKVMDITLASSGGNNAIDARDRSIFKLENVSFGNCGACINIDEMSQVQLSGALNINGSLSVAFLTNNSGKFATYGNTININTNLSFSQGFVYMSGPADTTFQGTTINTNSHTISGSQGYVGYGATLLSGPGGSPGNYFPGSSGLNIQGFYS